MAGEMESLDVDEGLERRRHRHWYDRLMMLCDGVFAIAITLLATEVRAPQAWSGDWASLWGALAGQLDAYAMSFLVISIYWLAHRRFMAMILTVDAAMTVITLVVLGLVALLPAATRLISTHSVYPLARLVYAGLVVAIGLAMASLWGYAALVAKVVSREVRAGPRWFILLLILFTPPFFLLLTLGVPDAGPGVMPIGLSLLFLIGWRLRRWTIQRLGGKGHHG
jgi:uncharacterized membrane protein